MLNVLNNANSAFYTSEETFKWDSGDSRQCHLKNILFYLFAYSVINHF